jgi:hypothetical protein
MTHDALTSLLQKSYESYLAIADDLYLEILSVMADGCKQHFPGCIRATVGTDADDESDEWPNGLTMNSWEVNGPPLYAVCFGDDSAWVIAYFRRGAIDSLSESFQIPTEITSRCEIEATQ